MSLFKGLRKSVAAKMLSGELKRKRTKRETVTFEEAHKIGLLFVAHRIDELETIREFIAELEQQGKKVGALGYVDITNFEKNNADSYTDLDFFYPRDVTWLYKPSGRNVHRFIKTDFDMLISLNCLNAFPLNYIAGFSKARFRVGQYHRDHLISYDFMIDTKTRDLKQLIAQVKHYLKLIKK